MGDSEKQRVDTYPPDFMATKPFEGPSGRVLPRPGMRLPTAREFMDRYVQLCEEVRVAREQTEAANAKVHGMEIYRAYKEWQNLTDVEDVEAWRFQLAQLKGSVERTPEHWEYLEASAALRRMERELAELDHVVRFHGKQEAILC